MEASIRMQRDLTPEGLRPASRLRILLADDEPMITDSLRRFLLRFFPEAEIRVAHDGLVALELAVRFEPQVMLLDLMMPVANGFEVCEQVRANPGLDDTRVIIISGSIDMEAEQRLRALGADALLAKPVHPQRVLEAMRPALQRTTVA